MRNVARAVAAVVVVTAVFAGLYYYVGGGQLGPREGAAPPQQLEERWLPSEHGQPKNDPKHPPIVMVIFDELPLVSLLNADRRIDAKTFPAFGRLAEQSTWYRNATAAAGFTANAVPATLTGRYTPEDALPLIDDHPVNLFTQLPDRYDFHVSEPLTNLCARRGCSADDARFDDFRELVREQGKHDAFIEVFEATKDDNHPADFGSFVADIEASRRPRMHFIHSLLPHRPWRYLRDGRTYTGSQPIEGTVGKQWRKGDWPAAHGYQRHLLQVELVDRLLGTLLERLEEVGIYDDALVVVAADHGVSHVPGTSLRVIEERTVGSIAPVPLFIKAPRQQRARINDAPVEAVDVMPTVLAMLGQKIPRSVDGQSAVNPGNVDRARKRFFTLKEGVTFPAHGRQKWGGLRHKLAVFDARGGRTDPWRLAPPGTATFLGREVHSLPRSRNRTASLHDPQAYAAIDLDAGHLPALVSGVVTGSTPPTIAVVLNDEIAAIAEADAVRRRGAFAFRAMVPPSSLRDGRNDVRIVEVDGAKLRNIPLRR